MVNGSSRSTTVSPGVDIKSSPKIDQKSIKNGKRREYIGCDLNLEPQGGRHITYKTGFMAIVVAHLAERLHPTSEDPGSNLVIDYF